MPVDPRFFAPFNLGELMRNAEAIRGSQSDREFRQHTMQQQLDTAKREAAARAALGGFITGQGVPGAPAPASPFAPHEGTHPGSLGSMIPAPQPAASPAPRDATQAAMAAAIRAGADPLQVVQAHRALRGETQTPTNIEREVAYYRSIGRNDLAEARLQNHAEGSPVVFDINGDGAPDLVPRSYFSQPGQTAPAPAPVRVNTPEEARQLPPGTVFQTPDGRTMRVPGGAGSGQPNFPGY